MAAKRLPSLIILSFLASLALTARCAPTPGPFIINTWPFTNATDAGFEALLRNSSALDAVEVACTSCEKDQCDGSVGFGGSPDESCETTLDAMIMEGTTMASGAVANLRRVKNAVGVARAVMEHTKHTLLAGDQATEFAAQNGFVVEDLSTTESRRRCEEWKAGKCQPNYRVNVTPNATTSCGPYAPIAPGSMAMRTERVLARGWTPEHGHDTISVVTIHQSGTMAAGTSTNGASHKVPGRVGDGPITGSGSYVDGDVGGCGATGDGDIMMRFLPCYQAVENLRRGMAPKDAAEDAVRRMLKKYPAISSGLIVVNKKGEHGGAASGWTGRFSYSYRASGMSETKTVEVPNLVA